MEYGRAYFQTETGRFVSLRALPAYMQETQRPAPDPDGLPSGIREGWRITFANRGQTPIKVQAVRLQKRKYVSLSGPYVTIWRPRPPQIVRHVKLRLSKKNKETPILPPDTEFEVAPHSSELVIVNVTDGDPGRYRVVVTADIVDHSGTVKTVSSDEFGIFIPNRSAEDLGSRLGISLINAGPFATTIAERLLTMTSTVFVPLAQRTNPRGWLVRPPSLKGLTQVLDLPDAELASRINRWAQRAKPSKTYDEINLPRFRISDHGPAQALVRWESGQARKALSVLTRYQAQTPDDPAIYPTLFRLLTHLGGKRRHKALRSYWKWLLDSPLRGTGAFFDAGLIYAETLKKKKTAENLLETAIYEYPESVSVLEARLTQLRNSPREAAELLEKACAFYPYVANERIRFRSVFVSGLARLTDTPDPSTASVLVDIHDQCPPEMQGVIRAESNLWPFAPELSLKPPYSLGVIQAWLAAGHLSRAMRAAQLLRYTEDGESCELLEILGDLTVRPSRLLEDPAYAAVAYQRALRGGQCDSSRTMALKAKRALALARSENTKALGQLVNTFKRPGAQLDAGDAVVQLMHGWLQRNARTVRRGLWKFHLRGGAADQLGIGGFTIDRLEALEDELLEGLDAMENKTIGQLPVPDALTDLLLTAYGRERALPRAPDSKVQQLYLAAAERFLSRSKDSRLTFIVRRRGQVYIGVKRRWQRYVLTPEEQPLERWVARSPRDEKHLKARYLKPLPVSLVSADRAALEARMHYQSGEFSEALEKAQSAIKTDPLHVGAYLILAQIAAVERNFRACRDEAKSALNLDPHHPLGQQLSDFCESMNQAQATKFE